MKKIISVLICLGILGGLTSCSKETTITKSSEEVTATEASEQDTKETMSSDQIDSVSDIDVDEGLLTVTITLPADLLGEEMNQEAVDKAVSENGYISGTYNDDGSVTYTMTKAQHQKVLKEYTESLDKSLQDMVDSDDYPNIVAITHNGDFTDFTITYAADEVSLVDSFSILVYYAAGGYYGVFSGTSPENIHVAFVNADTGEVIQESNSRDMASSEGE